MNYKQTILTLVLLSCNAIAQNGSIYETYKQPNYQGDSNSSTIFPKAFQEYNYIKTSRGIEVYRTYKHTNSSTFSTNRYYESGATIFSKSEPEFIIKNDGQVYRTYSNGTNRNSIFPRPFQNMTINKDYREKLSFDGQTLIGNQISQDSQE